MKNAVYMARLQAVVDQRALGKNPVQIIEAIQRLLWGYRPMKAGDDAMNDLAIDEIRCWLNVLAKTQAAGDWER